MNRLLLAGLVLAGPTTLSACSTHNSHSVVLDPVETLPVLVKEALLQLQENLGEPLPADSMAVGIAVDPVTVRWVAPADSPHSGLAAPAELQPLLLEAVLERIAAIDPEQARYVVNVALELDLNEPDELALRVYCDLFEAGGKGRALASACSGFVVVERLYCHGCRDSWSGLGTHISRHSSSGTYDSGYVYYPICPPQSPGYTKH